MNDMTPAAIPDADALCQILAEQMRAHINPHRTLLVGIHTGGVWVAARLHSLLGLQTRLGEIDVSFYRDDYSQRGLHPGGGKSHLPFVTEGAHLIIVDDVLYTGRTLRAAMNEIFDYGRPEKIELAVLVDRGGRELPIAATYCAHSMQLPAEQMLALQRRDDGALNFQLTTRSTAVQEASDQNAN